MLHLRFNMFRVRDEIGNRMDFLRTVLTSTLPQRRLAPSFRMPPTSTVYRLPLPFRRLFKLGHLGGDAFPIHLHRRLTVLIPLHLQICPNAETSIHTRWLYTYIFTLDGYMSKPLYSHQLANCY